MLPPYDFNLIAATPSREAAVYSRNRGLSWKRPKPDKRRRSELWPFGIALVGLGTLLILSGLGFTFVRPAIASSQSLFRLGALFVVVGVPLLILRENPNS